MTRTVHKQKPDRCNLCNNPIREVFVDGRTASRSFYHGTWVDMCLVCHGVYGVGLGLGKGQLYRRWGKGEDNFVKVEG